LPQLHLRTDAEGWASLMTDNFWRNLPSPGIALLTFGVCGFLMVYILGSRAFCAYGCPYGAAFRLADRFAPGRIRLKEVDCRQCGACTAACSSQVRVHEELNRFGMVVNPACLKDLDCVTACPKGGVYFGFGRPSLLKSVLIDTPIRTQYDFALWEEVLMVLVFLAGLLTFRGLYDRIPFFLSIGLAAVFAFLVVLLIRLACRPALLWNRWRLKADACLTPMGWAYTVTMFVFGAFTAHSAVIRYHSLQGRKYAKVGQCMASADESATQAIRHLEFAQRWGLLSSPQDALMLADMHYQTAGVRFKSGRLQEAENHLIAALHANPEMTMAHYDLGALLVQKGELQPGAEHLRCVVGTKPDFAEGHYNLALAHWMSGAYDDARREIDAAFRLNPKDEQTERLRTLMYEGVEP
jgi:ferredoxin